MRPTKISAIHPKFFWGFRSRYSARRSQKRQRYKIASVYLTSEPDKPQNFLALCASNYYDNCIFHRNIKGFMTQTGDPSGSGKGGQSIWGKPFEDELRSTLKVLDTIFVRPHGITLITFLHSLTIVVWLLWRTPAPTRTSRNSS